MWFRGPCHVKHQVFARPRYSRAVYPRQWRDCGARTDGSTVPEQYRPIVRWTAQQLYPEYERLLASWPKTFRVEIPGLGGVLFCHATPRNENECFTRLTPEDRLLPVFEGLTELWSSAVTPTCSLTERLEGFEL